MQKLHAKSRHLFTIGHSAHPTEHFLKLLGSHSIEVVVDARSRPYSKFAPQYSQEPLKKALLDAGFQYVYLGRELGGMPEESEYYDSDGRVLYRRVAASESFQRGLAQLESGLARYRVAVLCAEEDPSHCHRRLLITTVLKARGVNVEHIRGDGRLQPESEMEAFDRANQPQMTLPFSFEFSWGVRRKEN